MAHALGNDDDEVTLAGLLSLSDLVQNVVLHIEFLLRQQDSHSTGGDGNVQGNVTGVAAHDLDHTAAVVALGGVAQLVDHFQSGVHGCIIADGVLGAGNVVVDGAGQADHRNAAVCQLACAAVRTIAANDDQCVNAQLTTLGSTAVLAFLGLELQAAGSVQNSTAGRNDVRDAAQVHFKAFAVQQAVVTTLNADHAVTFVQAGTDHSAHGSIHARSIAAACEHANRFDLLFHTRDSLQFVSSFTHEPAPFFITPLSVCIVKNC